MKFADLFSNNAISSIASSAGKSRDETTDVLTRALPKLMSAMARNASTEEGAKSLSGALDKHKTAKASKSGLKAVDTADGAKILKKILGEDVDSVQEEVAGKSGVNKSAVSDILSLAAPLLLSAVSGEKKKTKTGDDGLSSLLTSLFSGGSAKKRKSVGKKRSNTDALFSAAGSLLSGITENRGKKNGSGGESMFSGLFGLFGGKSKTNSGEYAPSGKSAPKVAAKAAPAAQKKKSTVKKITRKKS